MSEVNMSKIQASLKDARHQAGLPPLTDALDALRSATLTRVLDARGSQAALDELDLAALPGFDRDPTALAVSIASGALLLEAECLRKIRDSDARRVLRSLLGVRRLRHSAELGRATVAEAHALRRPLTEALLRGHILHWLVDEEVEVTYHWSEYELDLHCLAIGRMLNPPACASDDTLCLVKASFTGEFLWLAEKGTAVFGIGPADRKPILAALVGPDLIGAIGALSEDRDQDEAT